MSKLGIRIVIMKPNHLNDIFVLKDKDLSDNKFSRGEAHYLINEKHFQLTTKRLWWTLWLVPRVYTTYYYAQGKPHPLPVPLFETTAVPDGVTPAELAAIFNAWFYRIIAARGRDAWSQLQFYISVGTLLGVLYIAWKISQGEVTITEPARGP